MEYSLRPRQNHVKTQTEIKLENLQIVILTIAGNIVMMIQRASSLGSIPLKHVELSKRVTKMTLRQELGKQQLIKRRKVTTIYTIIYTRQ